MKKILFVLIVLISVNLISINLVYAVQLGISPSLIAFEGRLNEKICKKAILFSNYNDSLIGESRWNREKNSEKDLKKYTLKPGDSGIEIKYPEKINVKNKKEIEVCLISKISGEHYGALIYRTENGNAGIGTWIYANITRPEEDEEGPYNSIKITGNAVNSNKEDMRFNKFKIILSFSLTIFLSFLLISLLALEKIKRV